MKLLEVKNLKTYFTISQGTVKAVDSISFDLDYGEALGLVGESGCGKTTSALSIAHILPKEGETPDPTEVVEGCKFCSRCPVRMDKCAKAEPVTPVIQPRETMPGIVSWGPIFPGEQDFCHEPNESISIETVEKCFSIYRDAIETILFSEESFK